MTQVVKSQIIPLNVALAVTYGEVCVVWCVFPAAGSSETRRLCGALDRPAGCVCFDLLANPGPPQMGGAAAQLSGNRMISGSSCSDAKHLSIICFSLQLFLR